MPQLSELRMNCCRQQDDSAWQLVKEAFRRDCKEFVNLSSGDASVSSEYSKLAAVNQFDTNGSAQFQLRGANPFANATQEDAYRYGYAAYHHFGGREEWNSEIETVLQQNWGDEEDWRTHRLAIRHGWFYAKDQSRHRN